MAYESLNYGSDSLIYSFQIRDKVVEDGYRKECDIIKFLKFLRRVFELCKHFFVKVILQM